MLSMQCWRIRMFPSTIPIPFDEARVQNWIARNRQRYQTDGFGLLAVVRKDTGELIGDCGLTIQNIHGHPLPEVGYHIRKDHWRQGYGSEAAAACVRCAFEHTQYPAVYSYMKYTNIPSRRTAMKCGMEFQEEYPDPDNGFTAVYTISRETWAIALQSESNPVGAANSRPAVKSIGSV